MRKVLAAVDLDERSRIALRVAARRATEAGAELGVCHVVPNLRPTRPLFPQAALATVGVVSEIESKARLALEQFVGETLGTNTTVTYILEEGEAYAEIVRSAETWGADLVVVGGAEEGGMVASLLGGVADRVVRYAHCTVLVARRMRARGHVLAATDLTDPSVPAVEAGAVEARLRGGGFSVLHVIPLPPPNHAVGAPLIPSRGELDEPTREAYVETISSELVRRGLDPAEATVRVVLGTPAATIRAVASSLDAELIVVGTRGRTGLARVLLGSVAEEVTRTSSASVLVVRLG